MSLTSFNTLSLAHHVSKISPYHINKWFLNQLTQRFKTWRHTCAVLLVFTVFTIILSVTDPMFSYAFTTILAFVLGCRTLCNIFGDHTSLTAFSRHYQSYGIFRTGNKLRRTSNRSANNTVVPTPAPITSVIPCDARIIVLSFMDTYTISWPNATCAVVDCSTRALTSGCAMYCKCPSTRVVHVLTGFIAA